MAEAGKFVQALLWFSHIHLFSPCRHCTKVVWPQCGLATPEATCSQHLVTEGHRVPKHYFCLVINKMTVLLLQICSDPVVWYKRSKLWATGWQCPGGIHVLGGLAAWAQGHHRDDLGAQPWHSSVGLRHLYLRAVCKLWLSLLVSAWVIPELSLLLVSYLPDLDLDPDPLTWPFCLALHLVHHEGFAERLTSSLSVDVHHLPQTCPALHRCCGAGSLSRQAAALPALLWPVAPRLPSPSVQPVLTAPWPTAWGSSHPAAGSGGTGITSDLQVCVAFLTRGEKQMLVAHLIYPIRSF